MVLNAFESIATSFSDNRKKLKENGLAAELAPTPPPPPLTPAPVATPVITPPIKPPPPVPAPTQMPTEIAVTLGALQQRGEQFGVDTTEFNYAAPDWNKVVAQMGEVNKVFDIMESDIDRPATPGPRAWEQGLGSGISQVLGDNFPQLFAESNPDASFWDRSLGRTIGATGRGLRQTIGRPALGVGRAIGEFAQKQLPIPEETIADLARPQEQKIADIFSDLGVIEPEQWHEFVEREGQIKADLLISRRLLAQMGSASWEIGTQATSEWSDEENLARNQYRIQRLLEIDPATGKTRAEGQLRNATNPAVLAGIALAMFEASEGVVTLGGRIALSQLGRQIDIANGGDGSKGEMWGDIIGSFIGGFPKNPAAGARVGAGAGTVYRNADEVAAGLRAIDRPVQQGAGIAGATGFDFAASEMRDLGQLAKIVGTPVLKAGRLAGTSALQAGEQAAAAVGRTGVDNVLDPAPPPVSRGMAGSAFDGGGHRPLYEIRNDLVDAEATVAQGIESKWDEFSQESFRIERDNFARELAEAEKHAPVFDSPEYRTQLNAEIEDVLYWEGVKKPPAEFKILDDMSKSAHRGLGGAAVGVPEEQLAPLREAGLIQPKAKAPKMTSAGLSQHREWEGVQRSYDNRYDALSDEYVDRDLAKQPSAVQEPDPTGFAEPDFAHEIGDTVSDASYLRFGEVVYIGDDVQPWKVDRVNGQLVDLDYIYKDVDSGGFVGLRAEKSHDVSKTPLIRSGFDYKNEVIPPRGTYKRESLDIAPPAPVAPVKAPRVTIRNVNKALADAGHDAKVHKGKDYIYFSGNDVGGWMQTSVSVPRLTDDLGLDTPATVDNWVKEFERMKASPDVNPDAAIEANRARYAPTEGQATLEGGVVPARTEQDIIDARTTQSGFDLTATGEDAPLRQADDAARGAGGQRGFNISEPRPSGQGQRFTVTNEGSKADAMLLTPDENGKVIGSIVDFETDPSKLRQGFGEALVRDTMDALKERGATSFEVFAERGSSPALFRKLGFTETGVRNRLGDREMVFDLTGTASKPASPTKMDEAIRVLGANEKLSPEQLELLSTHGAFDMDSIRKAQLTAKAPTTQATGTAAAAPDEPTPQQMMERLLNAGDREQALETTDAATYKDRQIIASPEEIRAASPDQLEGLHPDSYDNRAKLIQRQQDLEDALAAAPPDDVPGSHVGTGFRKDDPEGQAFFMPETAETQAAVLTKADEDGWTYVARHDPSKRGASYVEILDENGKHIDNVTNVIAEGDARFMVFNGERRLVDPRGTKPYNFDVPPPAETQVLDKSTANPSVKLTRLQRTHLKVDGKMLPSTIVTGSEDISRLRTALDEADADLATRIARSEGRGHSSDRLEGRKFAFDDLREKLDQLETPEVEPVARAGGVIEPPPALFLPKSADEAAARLNADADDDWTYVVRHDPKNTGGSRIDILDEGGERVGPVTDEIAKGDYAFVYNDAGDRVRIDLIEGDEAFYTSANKRTRKPVDRAAIESQLAPAAPEPPVAADPKFESQHGFNDDGTLTTFESQATEGIEQFDDKLAQSEMRLPKTQAELDADLLPSKAEMDAYFDEEQYLHDFSDGSTVDNAPMFETRHPDTPLGNAERKVDELEKELEGQAGYELEIEMEAIRDEIDQSPLAPLMEAFDGRQAEEGLYPDQYYKIFGDGGVRLIPTGKKGNVIQRDYITWALKAHPRDFKADRMVNKVFGAERRTLSQKRNWTIGLEHTDEIPEQYRTTQTYAQNPDADNFEANIPEFLDDIKNLRSQRDRLRDYDANIKGIQLEKAEELKEAKRQELLAANDEVILQQGIVEPVRGSLNAEGAAREFSEASRIPQVGYEEAFESDVLDIGAVSAHNISIQNPANFSDPVIREQAERYIRDLRGPYTPEEVAELSDFALGRLVAENISTQNPRRGTIGPGGKGVRPDVAKPVIGTGDPVEMGPPLDIPGSGGGVQQTTQGGVRPPYERIQPSKGLPYKINSPEEADRALGAVYNPNPEIKVQVAAANLRGTIESGGYRRDAEDAFVRSMPGEDISLTKEMYTAVDEQNIDDVGSRAGFRLDPGRIANTGDQGQSIGPVTNSIIETTQRLDDGSRVWGDAALRDWDRLLKKYRIRKASVFKLKRNNDLERFTIIMERLSGNDVMRLSSNPRLAKEGIEEFVPAEELLNKPSIKKAVQGLEYGDRIRFIQAAQDGRIFLDNLRLFQNRVRGKRGQKLIPLLPDYMPHIRRMTLWRKFGGLYEGADMKNLDMLDFTAPPDIASTPGYAFNPRALARKWGLKDDVRELNADKLVRSYITTTMKDVFHTEIDRNIKANTRHWRKATKDDYSLKNIADAFDTYSAEAYLGVPSRASKVLRDWWVTNRRIPLKYLVGGKIAGDRALPSFVDASIMLKRGLTRSVFPLNWTWNTFIQTSSGLLTPVRYGVRNSIRAIDAITSSSVKDDIDKFAYVARTKGRRGSSVVLQDTGDEVFAYSEDMPWQDRALEWASFLSIQIEKHLTRHAIRAAYLRGQKLGYEGAELWQYASQGGARTQSMYNKADTVGALRSRELSALMPFQTFAFEMLNTLAETNVPVLRNFTGKLGAYESFSANTARGKATTYGRLKNLAIWFAGAVAINAIADRASNRKPWNISSFFPGWALLSGGINGLGPGSAMLPLKFSYDVTQAVQAYWTHGDPRGMASLGLRYFGLPGGTQIDKSWAGVEAVQEGVVREKDRTTKFEVDAPEMTGIKFDIPLVGEVNVTDAKINPEEFIKAYGQGIWSTNGGQEYLDQQLGRSTEGQSTFGKIRAEVYEGFGLEELPHDRGGAQGKITRDIEEYLDAYYIIPTDPDVRKERGLPSRTTLRKKNPELDARLFAAGKVSTLSTGPNLAEAKRIAKELIVEYGLLEQGGGFFTGRGVDQEQENIFRKVLGNRWVDSIIGGAGNAPSSTQPKIREGYVPLPPVTTPAERQSSAPRISAKEGERLVRSQDKTPTEQWRLVSNYLTRENLVALQKIWDGKAISRAESSSLKAVFEKEPLGQTNFRTWSKQTLRQIQENSAVQMSREAVTV